jgi:nucleoside phosphorylase
VVDLVLERITTPAPAGVSIGDIPFPDGLKPVPVDPPEEISGPLSACDVVVMPYTYAEKQATGMILTPGVQSSSWARYSHQWDSYESQLTSRSPARDARCMATVCVTQIGSQRVLIAGSELHLSTDGPSMPVRQLVQQIASETGCKLFITTGTAGGVGSSEVLGDVVIAGGVKFNLADSQWEDESFAQQRFPAPAVSWDADKMGLVFDTLIPAAIGDGLKSSGYAGRAPELRAGDIETVADFWFADTADSYGIVKNDPQAAAEEMDDGAVCLALSEMDAAPLWMACRNASDPQMGGGSLAEQKSEAAKIYSRYGLLTTACSSLAVWAVIASQ